MFNPGEEEKVLTGKDALNEAVETLSKRTQEMIELDIQEERKEEEMEGLCEPLHMRWTKEAVAIVTQHLSEQ